MLALVLPPPGSYDPEQHCIAAYQSVHLSAFLLVPVPAHLAGVLSVCNDKLRQTLAGVIRHIYHAVVAAARPSRVRPRQGGPVRAALDAVKLLPQLALHGAKAGSLPHLGGLERVAAQHVNQQQMKVLATSVAMVALSVR